MVDLLVVAAQYSCQWQFLLYHAQFSPLNKPERFIFISLRRNFAVPANQVFNNAYFWDLERLPDFDAANLAASQQVISGLLSNPAQHHAQLIHADDIRIICEHHFPMSSCHKNSASSPLDAEMPTR